MNSGLPCAFSEPRRRASSLVRHRRSRPAWGAAGLAAAFAQVACSDPMSPDLKLVQLPSIQVAVLAPDSMATHAVEDTLVFLGLAAAEDLGVLPDDSVWWELSHVEVGRGRVLRLRLEPGRHFVKFLARYGRRMGGATARITVQGSRVGHILWMLPLDTLDLDGISLSPRGALHVMDEGGGLAVAVGLDGSVRWRTHLDVVVQGHPPAVAPDGTAYYGHWGGAAGSRGGVVAIGGGGLRKWIFSANEHGPPGSTYHHAHGGVAVGRDGTVYFGSEENDGPIYAVNPDGTLRWRTSTAADTSRVRHRILTHSTLVGDSLVVALNRSGTLVAVDARSGALRWRTALVPPGEATDPFPQFSVADDRNGRVIVGRGLKLVTLDGAGRILWERSPGVRFGSAAPVIDSDRRIYFANSAGGVYIYSRDGVLLARFGPESTEIVGAPALAARGMVYAAGRDSLYSYNASGDRRWAVPIDHRPGPYGAVGGPLIAPTGNVFFRASHSGVIAVRDTVGPVVDAPWPAFQGGPARLGRPE